VGLYVHVPFCAVRCSYCDFATGSLSSAALERYLVAIEAEAARRAESARGVAFTSVFFGGGTPSALSSRAFRRVMAALRGSFEIAGDAEITLEANPESVKATLLNTWAESGVNRLSMGAQSFDPTELAELGRIHDAERPGAALELARRAGFTRLSLDLMFGFPSHEPSTWERTLDRLLELAPEHLSAYCYIPEADTPMGREVLRGTRRLPEVDVQADLYQTLHDRVAGHGYGAYEISNFARPHAEARHNLVYWLRRDYLGLGPSAHGLWRGVRYGNHATLDLWAGALERGEPCDVADPETERSRSDEIVMLGLRLSTGLRPADYDESTWAGTLRTYGRALDAAVATGRLIRRPDGWAIPRALRFLSDDCIAWVMAEAEREPFDSFASRSVPSQPCPDRPFRAA
jgi:oxygen-independent coproporphyrinogen-3 oxidase